MKRTAYIYWPALMGAITVGVASLYDPRIADRFLPFSFSLERLLAMVTSWPFLLCVVPTVLGIAYARHVWRQDAESSPTDKMIVIWFLTNATWYHIGCDVFSGLFQVMPNLTEAYQGMNPAHFEPMHHPARLGLDSVYWFELFVQMPLCYATYWLFLKRARSRHIVVAFICGLHLTGTFVYYLPNLLSWESAHPLMSNLDRAIGLLWVVIPTLLTVRAVTEIRHAIPRASPTT